MKPLALPLPAKWWPSLSRTANFCDGSAACALTKFGDDVAGRLFPADVVVSNNCERAGRMVLDQEGDYASRWEAFLSIAGKIGCTAQTLHSGLRGPRSIRWLTVVCRRRSRRS